MTIIERGRKLSGIRRIHDCSVSKCWLSVGVIDVSYGEVDIFYDVFCGLTNKIIYLCNRKI